LSNSNDKIMCTQKRLLILKYMLASFVMITAPLAMHAQTSGAGAQDSIKFNKLEHDYGTIERGSDGQCEFTFTNKGNKPLILSNVRASCGCTVPQWTREPVGPGENGTIKVKYNTQITGAFNKTIIVNSNAANQTVSLRVKGQVVKPE
jgi:hypothetical protein